MGHVPTSAVADGCSRTLRVRFRVPNHVATVNTVCRLQPVIGFVTATHAIAQSQRSETVSTISSYSLLGLRII